MMRALLLLAFLAAAPMAQAETIAITGARAYTMTSDKPVENATIVVRDGRIQSVIAGGAVPAGARAIAAEGRIVTPGLMSSGTHLGLVEISDLPETMDHAAKAGPFGAGFDPAAALNANSALLVQARADGLTRAVTYPSASPAVPFAGLGALLRLDDGTEILERGKTALYATVTGSYAAAHGGSRALLCAQLRAALDKAKTPSRDPNDEALAAVLAKRIPLVITAYRESDMRQAIKLGDDYKIRVVLQGANEAWRVARELAQRKIPVVVNPFANLAVNFDSLGGRPDNAALLARAGVTLAYAVPIGRMSHDAAVAVREAAGVSVAHGVPWFEALKGLTVNAAQIWGIADHYGTLAPGRDADLVVWDGDPLQPSSAPLHVFVRGEEASLITRQIRLRDRYAPNAGQNGWPAAYR
jgi:imidazolonepropionase-like amidohydrolase